MLVVLVIPAVVMIGALLMERLERKVFTAPHSKAPGMSTNDIEASHG
jgi:hypothetical protein